MDLVSQLQAGNLQAFETLLQALQQSDNNARQGAEATFNQLKQAPDLVVQHLLQSLRGSQDASLKGYSAILLRKVLTSTDTPLWPSLSPNVQGVVKEQLLNAVREERLKVILKHVIDTISDLAVAIFENNGWPELLPFLFQCVQTNEESNIESALSIFAELAPYLIDDLKRYLQVIQQTCGNFLKHANANIRSAALRATSQFIQAVESAQERDLFQPLVGDMMNVINGALHLGDEASAQEALEMLIEMAGSEPRFLKKQLAEVVRNMLAICNTESFEASTRVLAAEFLTTLCEAREKAPGMMRKLGPEFTSSLFAVIMNFLLDIEEDPQWHQGEREEDNNAGEGELFDSGQEYLDRLSLSLGGKALAPVAAVLIGQWITDADWRKRHAVLICLAQIAEGCSKQMTSTPENLANVVGVAMRAVQDPHPRVRWAVCQGLGQLCTDLGPDVQESHHQQLMTALMTLMADPEPRVQAHSTAAIVNFSEMADPDIMSSYLDSLIQGLLTLLQGGRRIVQEGALTALAAVADTAESQFRRYYDVVMPLLLQILTNANDKSYRLLRGKAIECITLVGMSVGIDVFRAHAVQVCEYLMHLQNANLEDDDPTHQYMIQAWTRLCKVMGSEFLRYMDYVMPPLLKTAQIKTDIRVLEEGEEAEEDVDDFEEINLGSKRIMIKTSILDDKATACTMIKCYAEELKEGFWRYVEEVAGFMVPLLRFVFHDDVKSAAVNSLPELLNAAKLAVEKKVPGAPQDPAWVAKLLESMWDPLLESTEKESEVELLQEMVDSLKRMVEVAGKLLDAGKVQKLFACLDKVIDGCEERRGLRHDRSREEDFDQDEMEALAEEQEAEEAVADSLADVVGACLKEYGEPLMPLVETLLPKFNVWMTQQGRSITQKRIALGVYIDIIERASQGGSSLKFLDLVVPIILAGAKDARHPELQQCCVYALGSLAQHVPAHFPQILAMAYPDLLKVCSTARAVDPRSGEPFFDEAVVDNAISALGKVIEFHRAAIPGGDVRTAASVYLGYLPVRDDEYEARVVHNQLLRFVEASDPAILGDNNANLGKIVSVFLEVLQGGADLAEEADRAKIVALLQQMKGAMGPLFDQLVAANATTDEAREGLKIAFP